MSERAVSTAFNYTLILGISTILIVGLLTAGGNFVDAQRDSVVDSELEVIGERLASDIAMADRLVQAGNADQTLNLTAELPSSVSGSSYSIDIVTEDGNASVELTSPSLDRTVTAKVANTTALEPTSVSGGSVEIVYDQSEERLVVTDA